MNPLLLWSVLGESDRAHLGRLLDGSIPAGPRAQEMRERVRSFLGSQVQIVEEARAALAGMEARERERMLSELLWRVTCHLDGSVTRVLGVHTYLLGYGFASVVSEQEGGDVFCLIEDR